MRLEGKDIVITRIVGAILRDEQAVLTVSTRVPPSMDFGDVWLSLPAIVNRNGIARVLVPSLSDDEKRALKGSLEILKRHLASAMFAY